MASLQEQILAWLKLPRENEKIEFKRTIDQGDLIRYCAALANEGGGRLILGVTNSNPREICGTSAFNNLNEIKLTLYNTLRIKVDVFEEIMSGGNRVVIFESPARPPGVPIGYNGQYMMRVGESLVGMTPDQLEKIFRETKTHFLRQACSTGLSAAEIISKLDIQTFYDLLKEPLPSNLDKMITRLCKDGMVSVIRDSYAITGLGALLLARNLNDFPILASRIPRLLVYKGTNKIAAVKDIHETRGYAVGFQSLIKSIMEQLPTNELIKNALRREVEMYPELAVRELVANALIHQDFNETGATIMIEIYDDRIEISNPGQPLVSPDRFIDERNTRNEHLADFMRLAGICEERGSGIDKVAIDIELYQLPALDYRVSEKHTTAILYSHKSLEDMDNEERCRACYLHCCLQYVTHKRMTNQSLRERFKLPVDKSETVSRIISATIALNRIKPENPESQSRRFAKYVPYWTE